MGTTGPQTTSTTEPEKAGVETEVARPGARYLGELPSEARRRVVGRFMLIALVVNAVVLGVLLLHSSSDALPPESSFDSGASPASTGRNPATRPSLPSTGSLTARASTWTPCASGR